MKQRIGVLIVDDSAIVRETLVEVLSTASDIEVTGTASDPFIAAMKMLERKPDVIILDINMPRMDGLTFLKKIMLQHPMPVVVCSSYTEEGAEETIKALEYGAVDIITKPKVGAKRFLEESRIRICDAVQGGSAGETSRPRRSRNDGHRAETDRRCRSRPADRRTPARTCGHARGDGRIDRRHRGDREGALAYAGGLVPASWSCSTCPSDSRRPSLRGSTASAPSRSRRPRTATRSCEAVRSLRLATNTSW